MNHIAPIKAFERPVSRDRGAAASATAAPVPATVRAAEPEADAGPAAQAGTPPPAGHAPAVSVWRGFLNRVLKR